MRDGGDSRQQPSQKPTSRVRLTLHARNLKNVAGLGKGTSDPFAVVTLLASDSRRRPKVLGKTETIKNTLNPQWTKDFIIEYELGCPQHINVNIFDEIRKTSDKPMGSAMFELGEVMGRKGNIKAKKLRQGGSIFAHIDKAPGQSAGDLTLTLRGIQLKNTEALFLGKSDPFFELCRQIDTPAGLQWQPVYRSKHVEADLNPKWDKAIVNLDLLCGGDFEKPIQISVYDYEKRGKHVPMGTIETNVWRLLQAKIQDATDDSKPLNTSKAFLLKKRGKNVGQVAVTEAIISGSTREPSNVVPKLGAETAAQSAPNKYAQPKPTANIQPMDTSKCAPDNSDSAQIVDTLRNLTIMPLPKYCPTFVDYISGGLELQMAIAIDFTGSNGDPRIPGTLHYTNRDGTLNDYEKAITAVGSVIEKYGGKKFPIWGFGAKFDGITEHCFQCGPRVEAVGVDGCIEAYRSVFKTALTMSGPTVFNEVIFLAAAKALSAQESAVKLGQQYYTILLILTDGAVTDVAATQEALMQASNAPLSVVIVGIGKEDFKALRSLQEGGQGRNICHFVEFEAHKHSKHSFTKAVLHELPDQLVKYFQGREIMPLPKPNANISDEGDFADDHVKLSFRFSPNGGVSLEEGGYINDSFGTGGNYTGISVLPPPKGGGMWR